MKRCAFFLWALLPAGSARAQESKSEDWAAYFPHGDGYRWVYAK